MALLSWNCHGFKCHVSDIRDLVNKYHPVCFALQETLLDSNKSAKLKRYSTIRKDYIEGGRVCGGVALFTSHDYPFRTLNINTDLQAVAVQIHIHSLITVCNLYIPPNNKISQSTLNNLITQLPVPFIIVGDLNRHNPLWGSPNLNKRGRQIEKLISDHDLCIYNTNQLTYLHSPTRTFHSLDLAISSPQIFPFWNFTVDSYLYNSDHFPIILTHNNVSNANQRVPRFILGSADWDKFRTLANISTDMVDNHSVDEAVNQITETIISAADISIRKSSCHPQKQTKPWWNQECKNTYKDKRKAFSVFKRNPTTENFINYKKCKSIFRRTLRRSQRDSWVNYISSISSSISSKDLLVKVKHCFGVYPNNQIQILNYNNNLITSLDDIASTTASSLADISSSSNYSASFTKLKNLVENKPINFQTTLNVL